MREQENNLSRNEILTPIPHIGVCDAGGTISSVMVSGGYRVGAQRDLIGMLQVQNPSFIAGRFTIGETQVAFRGLSENMSDGDIDNVIQIIEDMVDSGLYDAILGWSGSDRYVHILHKMAERKSLVEKVRAKKIPIIMTCAEDDPDTPENDVWPNLEGCLNILVSDIDPNIYSFYKGKLIPAHFVELAIHSGSGLQFRDRREDDYWDEENSKEEMHIDLADKLHRFLHGGIGLASLINKYTADKNIKNMSIQEVTQKQKQELIFLCHYGFDVMWRPELFFGVYSVNFHRTDHSELLGAADMKWAYPNIRAIILRGYHSGTANTVDSEGSVAKLVERIRMQRNIVFFFVTENEQPTDLHAYETSVALRNAGVVPLYDMPLEAAVVKLDYAADNAVGQTELIDIMFTNLVGEIDESRINQADIVELKKLYRKLE